MKLTLNLDGTATLSDGRTLPLDLALDLVCPVAPTAPTMSTALDVMRQRDAAPLATAGERQRQADDDGFRRTVLL